MLYMVLPLVPWAVTTNDPTGSWLVGSIPRGAERSAFGGAGLAE